MASAFEVHTASKMVCLAQAGKLRLALEAPARNLATTEGSASKAQPQHNPRRRYTGIWLSLTFVRNQLWWCWRGKRLGAQRSYRSRCALRHSAGNKPTCGGRCTRFLFGRRPTGTRVFDPAQGARSHRAAVRFNMRAAKHGCDEPGFSPPIWPAPFAACVVGDSRVHKEQNKTKGYPGITQLSQHQASFEVAGARKFRGN